MKRTILILLILATIGVYSWDVYLLIGRGVGFISDRGPDSVQGVAVITAGLPVLREARFEVKGKSPLLAYKEAPRPPKPPVVRPVVAKPKFKVHPPAVTVTGIMWNPQKPLAMISLPGGGSTVAAVGQEHNGIAIKKIEQSRIQIEYQGHRFWIDK